MNRHKSHDTSLGRLSLACAVSLFLAGGGPRLAAGQSAPERAAATVDSKTRTAVIEAVLAKIDQEYVDPKLGRGIQDAIRHQKRRGAYDQITSAEAFADSLTSHLRAASGDRHLSVRYNPDPAAMLGDSASAEDRAREEEFARMRNYGFEEVKRLRGNVGYLRLRGFISGEEAGKAAAAAMQFLAHTDALVIDLRENGGGAGEMVQLLGTYLMPPGDPVRLTDIYSRTENFTQQFWTLPWVPGPRYAGKDVYLLTSGRTFSAAEEFCYDLQNLKRVTIVGETTGGGAHPVKFERVGEHFVMSVAYAKAVNPVSKTNWEGVGVKPDVSVAAAEALKTAHILALKSLQKTAKDPEMITRALTDVETTGESSTPMMMSRPDAPRSASGHGGQK